MDGAILKAVRSKSRNLTLDNSSLQSIPASISQLHYLESLSLRNNLLQSLPLYITRLKSVSKTCAIFMSLLLYGCYFVSRGPNHLAIIIMTLISICPHLAKDPQSRGQSNFVSTSVSGRVEGT